MYNGRNVLMYFKILTRYRWEKLVYCIFSYQTGQCNIFLLLLHLLFQKRFGVPSSQLLLNSNSINHHLSPSFSVFFFISFLLRSLIFLKHAQSTLIYIISQFICYRSHSYSTTFYIIISYFVFSSHYIHLLSYFSSLL